MRGRFENRMNIAGTSNTASARGALLSLGDWFVVAVLSLPMALAAGILTASPLGQRAIDVSLVAGFVGATVGGLTVALLARVPGEIAIPAPSTTVIYAALGADLAHR